MEKVAEATHRIPTQEQPPQFKNAVRDVTMENLNYFNHS